MNCNFCSSAFLLSFRSTNNFTLLKTWILLLSDRLLDKSDKSALLGGPLVSVGSGGGSETSTPTTSRSQFFRSPKRRSLIATSNSAAGAVTATSSPMPIRQRKSSLSFTSPCRSFPGNIRRWYWQILLTELFFHNSKKIYRGISFDPFLLNLILFSVPFDQLVFSWFFIIFVGNNQLTSVNNLNFPGTDPSIEGQSSLVLRSSLSTSPRRKISDTLHFLGSPSSSSHKSSSCQCHGHHSWLTLRNSNEEKEEREKEKLKEKTRRTWVVDELKCVSSESTCCVGRESIEMTWRNWCVLLLLRYYVYVRPAVGSIFSYPLRICYVLIQFILCRMNIDNVALVVEVHFQYLNCCSYSMWYPPLFTLWKPKDATHSSKKSWFWWKLLQQWWLFVLHHL